MAKKWILVVDDDPAILAMLEEALQHPAFTVTTAADALQAFIQARDLKPFLIISDIQMPGFGDGPSALKRLREDPRFPKVPMIFITGMDLAKARELLPKNDPTIGLMPKPIDLDKICRYVWALAGVPPPAPPQVG